MRGAVPKGRFLVGRPWEMAVAGVVRMYLPGSERSARQAYVGEYRLEPLTLTSTWAPSVSVGPTAEPPLGASICQCDADNRCTTWLEAYTLHLQTYTTIYDKGYRAKKGGWEDGQATCCSTRVG